MYPSVTPLSLRGNGMVAQIVAIMPRKLFLNKSSELAKYVLYIYALLKPLPPVCMKYTARGESRVANIV